jgi:hypothetical protein
VEEPSRDEHRAHQPTEVGQPEEPVARTDVHEIAEVVGALEQEAALREHRALGPPRRPRRVDDQARTVELAGQGRAHVGLLTDQLVPPAIAPLAPRDLAPEPLVDDHALHRRRRRDGLVGRLLHLHDLAAPVEAVSRDERLRLAVLEPRSHRLGAVAREARRVDRADSHDRQGRDRGLGRHRQEHADAVALADSQALERVGELADLTQELGIGQRARAAVVAFPDERRLRAAPGLDVSVDAVVGEVHQAALEPPRPRQPARDVANARVRTGEAKPEILDDRVPVPVRVSDASLLELLERAHAERAHEAG